VRPKPIVFKLLAIGAFASSACTGVGPLGPSGVEFRVTVDNVVLAAIGSQAQLELELPDGMSTIGLGAVWRSNAPTIVSVDDSGRVTALRHGVATITAEAAGVLASTTVTVDADIVRTASVRSNEGDPAAGNNVATVTITVQAN